MHLYLRIENDRITDAKFKTMGCPAAIAAGSVTTELLIGRGIEAALKLSRAEVNTALGAESSEGTHVSIRRRRGARGAEEVSAAVRETDTAVRKPLVHQS